MSAAAAKIGPHVLANFIVGRMAVDAQQCLRAHHHAGNAVPALRRLFIDEGLLELIWLAVFYQSLTQKFCSAGSLRVIHRLRDGSEALIRDVDASA